MDEAAAKDGLPAKWQVKAMLYQWACDSFDPEGPGGRNPVFLFQLLEDRYNLALEEQAALAPGDADAEYFRTAPLPLRPLPRWAEEWLSKMGRDVRLLGWGRDPRGQQPLKWAALRANPYEGPYQGDEGESEDLTAAQSASQVGAALGLTWGAFLEFRAIMRAEDANSRVDQLESGSQQGEPVSRGQAYNLVMRNFGFEDQRAFMRFLKRRRRRDWPLPPFPGPFNLER